MSKTILNFWLDACLLTLFLTLCTVSAILQFVFPSGASAAGWTLWGGDIMAWRDAQFVVLCIFAAGILLHVMLHWSWICGVIATRFAHRKILVDDGVRTIWGVATLIFLLHVMGAVVTAAFLMIEAHR